MRCKPTTYSGMAPNSYAAPCVPVDKAPAIVCPLLAPDVYTLAAHGANDPSVVRLADRADV